ETAGRRRSARGGGGRDRAAAPGDGREGSAQLGDRRGGDARAGAPRRGGLRPIRQRLPLLQGPRRVHERAEGADLGAQERAEEVTGEDFMRLALAEAEKGRGRTHPNPAVGAVVVRGGRVISRGHHEKAGLPHAEVNALREAGRDARGADVYVTLEPCNHQERTPPCTAGATSSMPSWSGRARCALTIPGSPSAASAADATRCASSSGPSLRERC